MNKEEALEYELGKQFMQSAKSLCDKSELEEEYPYCPDQYVGLIGAFTPCSDFLVRKSATSFHETTKCAGRVVLVLESPHIDEYETTNAGLVAKGPACGCTGCKIRYYFNSATNGKYSRYEMVLINVIRYPCSLFKTRAESGGAIRDKMIRKLLKSSNTHASAFMDNFVSRIKKAININKNVLILNACSKVGKDKIRGELEKLKSNHVSYTEAPHPVTWLRSTTIF